MDLVIALVVAFVLSFGKLTNESESTDTLITSIEYQSGSVSNDVVSLSTYVIGNNLDLIREPRAYHKILDELGL